MINLYQKYVDLNRSIYDVQYLINIDGIVKAYYGINADGLYRLSFLSSKKIDINESTKSIFVTTGLSSQNNNWTCFDLKNESLLSVFCTFGEDLISCILTENDEDKAISKVKARFSTWLMLFKKGRKSMTDEQAKGLFGELYFLDNYLIDKYNEHKSITGWSGPNNYSKDFSIDETWFEIKTIYALSPVVKISSIQQLSSEKEGHLIVIRVEEMSDAYSGFDSSINEICASILARISDEYLKDRFLSKVSDAGYDFSDDVGNKKYKVEKMQRYIVNETFPTIKERDIADKAINNVSYDLIIKMLDKYKED